MSLPRLKFEALTYCGIRDIDDFEAKIIKEKNIRVLDVAGTIDYIRKTDAPIHISFDVDALDPSLISSTGTRVDNGLMSQEVMEIIGNALNEDKLVSLDVVEFNTALGDPEESLKHVQKVFEDCKGGLSKS